MSGPVPNRSKGPRPIPRRIKSGRHTNNGSLRLHLSQGQTPSNPAPAYPNLLNSETRSARQVRNDSRLAFNARPDPEPAPSALPAQPPTSAQRTSHDGEGARHGTDDTDVTEGVWMDDDSLQTVRRQNRRKKNNKITVT